MAKNTYQSRLDVSTSKDSCSDVLDLFERKDFKKALKICEARLKEDKNIYTLLNLKALIFSELGEYEKAVKIFDEALSITDLDEIKVNKAKTLYAWAKRLYFPDYNYQKAIEVIDEAIELLSDGDLSEFYFLKAEILEALGDNIEARKYYYMAEGKLDELEDLEKQLNLFQEYHEDTLINVTGYKFYKGLKPFKKGVILDLIKDTENEHDRDAIAVILDDETVGYVANSDYSVIDEVKSASNIKHMFKQSAKAEVLFIYLNELVIARLIE